MKSEQLYMIQLQIDSRKLSIQSLKQGLLKDCVDEGYYIHQQLLETFGKGCFTTFSVVSQTRGWFNILGYSTHSPETLKETAQAIASPLRYNAINWCSFMGKPMPRSWKPGKKFRFEVRACPVSRLASPRGLFRKGAEIDVFLVDTGSECPENRSREAVYTNWLCEKISKTGAARVSALRLTGFKRVDLLRRTQGETRKATIMERPETQLSGVIEVIDSDSFNRLISRGIGRHASFGFGMILLKPFEGC